jgi:heptaprenyl diphosphate synthase
MTKSIKYDLIAKFAGLSLFLSTIEYLFPRPLPFFRLGIANTALLLALEFLNPVEFLLLLTLKVLGQGLLNGTFASYVFIFSLSGTMVSGTVMYLANRWGGRHISLVGVSLLGSLFSNLVQVTLSVLIVFGTNSLKILPWFLLSGMATGLLVGIFAKDFKRRSKWLELERQK